MNKKYGGSKKTGQKVDPAVAARYREMVRLTDTEGRAELLVQVAKDHGAQVMAEVRCPVCQVQPGLACQWTRGRDPLYAKGSAERKAYAAGQIIHGERVAVAILASEEVLTGGVALDGLAVMDGVGANNA